MRSPYKSVITGLCEPKVVFLNCVWDQKTWTLITKETTFNWVRRLKQSHIPMPAKPKVGRLDRVADSWSVVLSDGRHVGVTWYKRVSQNQGYFFGGRPHDNDGERIIGSILGSLYVGKHHVAI